MQTTIKYAIARTAAAFLALLLITANGRAQTDSSVQSVLLAGNGAFTGKALSANTNGFLDVSVKQPDIDHLKFSVRVNNPEKKKVSITVSQKNAGILHSQHFSSESFGGLFNMEDLDDGEYSIIVSSDNEKIVKDISINTVVEVNRIAKINPAKKQENKAQLAF